MKFKMQIIFCSHLLLLTTLDSDFIEIYVIILNTRLTEFALTIYMSPTKLIFRIKISVS